MLIGTSLLVHPTPLARSSDRAFSLVTALTRPAETFAVTNSVQPLGQWMRIGFDITIQRPGPTSMILALQLRALAVSRRRMAAMR